MLEMKIVIAILAMILGQVLLARKGPAFVRSDEDKLENIHWLALDVDEAFGLKILALQVGMAQSLNISLGKAVRLPEKWLEQNRLGAIVTLQNPIIIKGYEVARILVTQKSAVQDMVDAIATATDGNGWSSGDFRTGKGTKKDPEVEHQIDFWDCENRSFVLRRHAVGGRSYYSAKIVEALE